MRKHDVVIIGGSLAASSCALRLRARGIDAVALERDRFPRNKVCGAFLSPAAVSSLEELDMLRPVLAAGAVTVRSARVRGFGTDFTIQFETPGISLSRRQLDYILAAAARVQERTAVMDVQRRSGGFNVSLVSGEEVNCAVVVDAAGKLSRFTKRIAVEEYGVNREEAAASADSIDFWFSEDAYGGSVSIEGNRRNICYLVRKPALRRWLSEAEWQVTGPLAYDRAPGPCISIGDAAGMVDPFCGDGMAHALASGIVAADVIAGGLDRKWDYERMRQSYDYEWARRWSRKRILAGVIRAAIQRRYVAPALFHFAQLLPRAPGAFLRRVWTPSRGQVGTDPN